MYFDPPIDPQPVDAKANPYVLLAVLPRGPPVARGGLEVPRRCPQARGQEEIQDHPQGCLREETQGLWEVVVCSAYHNSYPYEQILNVCALKYDCRHLSEVAIDVNYVILFGNEKTYRAYKVSKLLPRSDQ